MSDFHRAPLEMAWLRLCRITNESTEIENCYSSLNKELRWLWNSVYNHAKNVFIVFAIVVDIDTLTDFFPLQLMYLYQCCYQ